jgi:hypothetical protein
MNLTKFGGSFAKISDPPPGNMVMVRGIFRLTEIQLGIVMGEQSWIIKRLTGYTISRHTNQDVDVLYRLLGRLRICSRLSAYLPHDDDCASEVCFRREIRHRYRSQKKGGAVAPPSLGRKHSRKQQSKASYYEVTYTFRSSRTQPYSQQHRVNFLPEMCSKEWLVSQNY